MAKKFETIVMPARKRDVAAQTQCDICSEVAPAPDGWETHTSMTESITVRRETGSGSADGGLIDEYNFDVCPSCWDAVLRFFKRYGSEPRHEKREW